MSRHAILEAAEALFAEHGPDRVSLAEIAEHARVSRGLPSYFFANKETLYRTVLEQAASELELAVLQVMKSERATQPSHLLSRLIDCYVDYLAAHPNVVRLLQWNALQNTARHKAAWASRVPTALFEEVLDLLGKRLDTKTLGGLDVRELLISTVSMCLFPFQIRPALPREVARRKQHIRTVILRAIRGMQ